MRRAGLFFLGSFTALAACTFPDVDYADGGTGSTTSTSSTSSGTGGSCPGLASCTTAAATCSSAAANQYASCLVQCHGSTGCLMKCATDRSSAEAVCAAQCESCAPPGCTSATADCQKASGL